MAAVNPAPCYVGQAMPPRVRLAEHLVAAVVFDMDGVVTDTARMHAGAWRAVLDEALSVWAPAAALFDPDVDYRRHVDGRPRRDGARIFLASRGVHLPEGDPAEPPGTATVWQVANAKNARLAELPAEHGVGAFASTVSLLRRLHAGGVPVAVVTASRNADTVLAAAGVDELVDVVVDGGAAERLGLAGKPDPATFLEAARRLGWRPTGRRWWRTPCRGCRPGGEAGSPWWSGSTGPGMRRSWPRRAPLLLLTCWC